MKTKLKSARLLATGRGIRVKQEGSRLFLRGLPEKAPDSPCSVIVLECASRPRLKMGTGMVELSGWERAG